MGSGCGSFEVQENAGVPLGTQGITTSGTISCSATAFSTNTTKKQTIPTLRKKTTISKETATVTTATSAVRTSEYSEQTADASHLIQGVPLICQFPEFPTGCESVATIMALQYTGETISVSHFIDNYLSMGAVYRKHNVLYGPDPYESFVGDPRSQYSLGCYAPVIQNALIQYFGDAERIKNTTGETLDTLCRRYVLHDIPVLVWVSIDMKEPGQGNVWYTEAGKQFQWITKEHCMVLIGYDENGYYFNDPYSGEQRYYEKNLSVHRYETFGRQSVVIIK